MSRKLILATGILGGIFLAGQAAATTLTFATNSPPTGLRGLAEKNLIDTIQAETDLKVKAFWGASLVKGQEVLTAVQKGVADIGPIQINYHPKKLLLNSALNLFPQGPTKYETMIAFYDKIYSEIPELGEEFAKFDQMILHRYITLPYAVAANKPITKLADLKGMKIRAASRWYLKLLSDAGATPVSMPFSDTYMALQTGTINGVFTNYDAIARVKMDEVAQNLWIIKQWWLPAPYLVTMSLKKFNKLSPDEQKALLKASASAEKKYAAIYASLFTDIVNAEKKAGYKIAFASDEDVATWMKVPSVEGNRETWIAEAKEQGVTNAEAVLKKIGKYVDEAVKSESAAK